jgi:hypothetical protein
VSKDWLSSLHRDGLLVGLDWSGKRAQGYDVNPADVRRSLTAREPVADQWNRGPNSAVAATSQ